MRLRQNLEAKRTQEKFNANVVEFFKNFKMEARNLANNNLQTNDLVIFNLVKIGNRSNNSLPGINLLDLDNLKLNFTGNRRAEVFTKILFYGKASGLKSLVNSEVVFIFVCSLYSFMRSNPETSESHLIELFSSSSRDNPLTQAIVAPITLVMERKPIYHDDPHIYLTEFISIPQKTETTKYTYKTKMLNSLITVLRKLA